MEKSNDVKYYKAFDPGLSCRGFLYKVGYAYCMDEAPVICRRGFHYCPALSDVYRFYPTSPLTRVCLVTPFGKMVCEEFEDLGFMTSSCKFLVEKFCTNRIRIDRELEPDEIVRTLVEERDELKFQSDRRVVDVINDIRARSDIILSRALPEDLHGLDPKWIMERAKKFRSAFADAFPKKGRR